MGLYRTNLIKLDLSQEEEDVTRYCRVEDYVKGQQHYKYPCLSYEILPSETNEATNGVSLADDMSQSSSRCRTHCQRTSTRSILAPLSPVPTLSKEQTPPGKRPLINSINNHTIHHSTKKHIVRRQAQRQHKQGEQRKRQVQPGLGLLEKFTSPNIEMDHITLRQNGLARPRMGLFNKGKSSARGKVDANISKYVSDLVFSEASFLRRPVTAPTNRPLNVTTNTTRRTPTKQLSSSKHPLSSVISDSHSGKSIADFFKHPPQLSIVTEVAQEPSTMPTIVEPKYEYHQYAIPVTPSDNRQLLHHPERQIPYYTRGITPNAPRLDSIVRHNPFATFTSGTRSVRSVYSSRISMVASQQPDYRSYHHQDRHSSAHHATTQIDRHPPPSKMPPVSLFATLEGPKPFRPTKNKSHHHHYCSATPSSAGSLSLEPAPLHMSSRKPIYPVFSLQPKNAGLYDGETRYRSSINLSDSDADEFTGTTMQTAWNTSPFLYQPNAMYTGRSPQQQRHYSPQPIYKAHPQHNHPLASAHLYHNSQAPDDYGTSSPSLASYF
ncbi:hypothetical protein [Absidia glauca]|uniref:Uncharacterized protein n=1 Tax=Absidia glauca TaxID=4829 RepID=A0A168QLN9_ABSGL|nr:hypothetical protein [Absidia glauca]